MMHRQARQARSRKRLRRRLFFLLLLIAIIAAEGAVLRGYLVETKRIDWRLILVNDENPMPEKYDIELTDLFNGTRVDSRIYPDLQRMFDDARAQGLHPIVSEGYRTREEQEAMLQIYVDRFLAQGYSQEQARELALDYVAEPGTSEHELGIAVDINASEGYSSQAVYSWLADNAWRYGFILRYPSGKEEITGISYEPWHYRYVGADAAAAIYEQGLTLEEYLH